MLINIADHLEELQKTMGASENIDLNLIVDELLQFHRSPGTSLLDIGCGRGNLGEVLKLRQMNLNYSGMDLLDYPNRSAFPLALHNLNEDFPRELGTYDFIVASHVMLYLENFRHFLRQCVQALRPGGRFIVVNPNPQSWRSIISFIVRGHAAYAPPRYPAHINVPSLVELKRAIGQISEIELEKVNFNNFGRCPGVGFTWQSFLPCLRGLRFSDAYLVVIRKK